MTEGSMEDIDHTTSSQQDDVEMSDVSGSQSTQRIYEKEAKIKIDYTNLSEELREVGIFWGFFNIKNIWCFGIKDPAIISLSYY